MNTAAEQPGKPAPANARRIKWQLHAAIFGTLSVLAALACWAIAGEAGVSRGFATAGNQIADIAVQLVFGLVIAASISILLPRDKVARWLGADSGFKGLALASVLGSLMPGAPMAAFPIVVALGQAGARQGTLVAFLTGWAALSIPRLFIWEIPLLGLGFGTLRLVAGLPLPILAGLGTDFIYEQIERRREKAHG